MKKIILFSAISILALSSCDKQNGAINNTNTNNDNKAVLKTVSRTVGTITFSGTPHWFEFGNRQQVAGQWTCGASAGVCKYKAISVDDNNLPNGAHTATGELVYTENQFLIAIDKASLLDTPGVKDIFISSNNTFNVTAATYMKNVADANPNTIGDILIPRGDYQVMEDANTILIVFWNK